MVTVLLAMAATRAGFNPTKGLFLKQIKIMAPPLPWAFLILTLGNKNTPPLGHLLWCFFHICSDSLGYGTKFSLFGGTGGIRVNEGGLHWEHLFRVFDSLGYRIKLFPSTFDQNAIENYATCCCFGMNSLEMKWVRLPQGGISEHVGYFLQSLNKAR